MTTTTPKHTLEWILPFVRESCRGYEPYKEFTLVAYIQNLWTVLERANTEGIKRDPSRKNTPSPSPYTDFFTNEAPERLRNVAIEALNYLLSGGLFAPTVMDTNLNGLRGSHPYFITQRGADWAASKQLMPEDSAEYMKLVKQLVPALDPVIEQYISEGLSSFVGRHYFASAVMVGAASEKAVYILGDSMYGALKDPKDQKDLQSFLNGRSMKQLFGFIRHKLEKTIDLGAKKCPIPYPVHEGAAAHFGSLVDAIRVQRNDAVHPQNAAVTPDSVRLSYGAFPHALEKMEKLGDWFKINPGSI